MTPNSGASSLISVTSFLRRVDYNVVGQLVADDKTPVAPVLLQTNDNLDEILKGASGELESFCTRAERYSPADLAALTGNSARYRDDVLTGLALPRLFMRRPDLLQNWKFWIDKSDKAIKALSEGEAIFGFLEVAAAGLPVSIQETWLEPELRNLTPIIMRRFFGRRGNQQGRRSGSWFC